jgi:hypothetical protein
MPFAVIACSTGMKLGPEHINQCEEVLNQAACLVELAIVIPRLAAIGLGGDYCRLAGRASSMMTRSSASKALSPISTSACMFASR